MLDGLWKVPPYTYILLSRGLLRRFAWGTLQTRLHPYTYTPTLLIFFARKSPRPCYLQCLPSVLVAPAPAGLLETQDFN